jgi:hypothetical protein
MQSRKQRKPLMIRVLKQYLSKRSQHPLTDQPKMPARKLGQRGRISR